MVERRAEAVYWDLEYERDTAEPFTEIQCPECDEWSPRDEWSPGELGPFVGGRKERAMLCPKCSAVTVADPSPVEVR